MMKALAACVSVLFFTTVAFAEPPATISPLGDLPRDMQIKMARLAQILAGAIQSGRLSDATIQSAMTSVGPGDQPTERAKQRVGLIVLPITAQSCAPHRQNAKSRH